MKIAGGYILQPRCFGESEAAHLPPATREIWFYLLRSVNHKDNGKHKRGQGHFVFEDIQRDLSWDVGFIRKVYSKVEISKALRRLRERNMVDVTKATRGVYITICKYEYYQDPKNYEGNAKETGRKREGIHDKQECKNERTKEVILKPDFVSEKTWKDLLEHRKNKKAVNSEKAISILVEQLKKAVEMKYTPDQCVDEMINRNWTGFKAEWLPNAKVQPYDDGFY